jgi:hypothetical protein
MGSPVKHVRPTLQGREQTEYHQVDYLPAEKGCRAVFLCDGEVYFKPLLGWRIETVTVVGDECFTYPEPVTPEGVIADGEAVLFPDGTVHCHDMSWDSLDEWTKEQMGELPEGAERVQIPAPE